MFMLSLRALAAAAAVGLLVVGCGSKKSSEEDAQQIKVTLTSAGCDPATINAKSGPIKFTITNQGANAVSELEVLDGNHVIGEVENVIPGLSRSFTINANPGEYTLACPGGTTNARGKLIVTGSARAAATPTGPVTTVSITERDWAIEAASASGPAGDFTFDIRNDGPTTHEFVIIKTDVAAASLPVANSEVNEGDSRLQHIDEVEDLEAQAGASFTVNLKPGHYVFICNIATHYQQGMHADFTVN
ncbi:MAG TPA: cupredoxin domain-containing protein [Dehalococcoidia bacterium]|jgi:uncharacterized cupredoxin-like copper-binding protein